jgi:hypothetical protein
MSEQASAAQVDQPSVGRSSVWKSPATRVFFVTSAVTALVLAIATWLIFWEEDSTRRKIEDQYSRQAAHFAEEIDLRIESYRRVAGIVTSSYQSIRKEVDHREATEAAKGKVAKLKEALASAVKWRNEAGKATASSTTERTRADIHAYDQWSLWTESKIELDVALREAEAAKKKMLEATEAAKNAAPAAPPPLPNQADADVPAAQDAGPAHQPWAATPGDAASSAEAAVRTGSTDGGTSGQLAQKDHERDYARAIGKREKAIQKEADSRKAALEALTAQETASRSAEARLAAEAKAARNVSETQMTFYNALGQARIALSERQDEVEGASSSLLRNSEKCVGIRGAEQTICLAEIILQNLDISATFQGRPHVVACSAASGSPDANGPLVVEENHAFFRLSMPFPSNSSKGETTGSAGPSGNEKSAGASSSPASNHDALCLRVPLDALVPFSSSSLSESREVPFAFSEILLVERTSCHVLRASGTDPQARIADLPGCGSIVSVTKPASSAGETALDVRPKRSGGPSSAVHDVGGIRYQMFQQGVRTSTLYRDGRSCDGARPCTAGSLLVVGLVRGDRISEQLHALSPMMFLFIVALASLALFSWPFAKLWFVGPRSVYTRFDSAFLATAALSGTLLCTMVMLALLAEARLTARLDDQLERLGTDISSRLDKAIGDASKSLDSFAEKTAKVRETIHEELRGHADGDDFGNSFGNMFAERLCHAYTSGSEKWPDAEEKDVSRGFCLLMGTSLSPLKGDARHPILFWVNGKGYEQVAAHDLSSGSPPVNVSQRSYFQLAKRAGALPKMSNDDPGACPRLDVPEVVRSLTSISKVLVVARATDCADRNQAAGVAGFEQEVGAFKGLALPPGVEWAVIDHHGKIMLHSSLDDHHGHVLFEDLDGASTDQIRASILASVPGERDGEYNGARSRIRGLPNATSGWYVVALGSYRYAESALRNTLATTLAAFGIFVAVALLVAAGLSLRFAIGRTAPAGQTRHVFRLIPHGDKSNAYASAALRFAAQTIALVLATALLGPQAPTALLLVLSLAFLLCAATKVPGVWFDADKVTGPVEPDKETKGTTWRDKLAVTYTFCTVAFSAAFVVAPTTICFFGSFAAAMDNELAVEQLNSIPAPGCTVHSPTDGACPKRVQGMEPVLADAGQGASFQSLLRHLTWPLPELMARLRTDMASLARVEDNGRGLVAARSPGELALESGSLGPPPWALRSGIPRLSWRTKWSNVGLVLLLSGVAAAGAAAVAYASLKRLYFLDILIELKGDAPAASLATPEEGTTAVGTTEPSVEFSRRPVPQPDAQSKPPERKVLLLYPPKEKRAGGTDADRGQNPREVTLSLAAFKNDPPSFSDASLVKSDVDPFRRIPLELREKWARALTDFVEERGQSRGPTREPSFAHFMYEWSVSDAEEQRVLAQLALYGHVAPHPSNGAVVYHLAARGLIHRDTLAIENTTLDELLRRTVTREQMQSWQVGDSVAWDVVRVPLVTAVAIFLGVVGVSHPEIAGSGALLLPPMAASVPAAMRALALLVTGRSQSPPV